MIHASGRQIELSAGEHRAVAATVGASLRTYIPAGTTTVDQASLELHASTAAERRMTAAGIGAVVIAAAVLAACGADAGDGGRPASDSRVEIVVDRDGKESRAPQSATLQCPSERHPRACRRLSELAPSAFEPVPAQTACAQLYGGPERARIEGVVEGRSVSATFTRRNGCEITRYERVRPVLEVATG